MADSEGEAVFFKKMQATREVCPAFCERSYEGIALRLVAEQGRCSKYDKKRIITNIRAFFENSTHNVM